MDVTIAHAEGTINSKTAGSPAMARMVLIAMKHALVRMPRI